MNWVIIVAPFKAYVHFIQRWICTHFDNLAAHNDDGQSFHLFLAHQFHHLGIAQKGIGIAGHLVALHAQVFVLKGQDHFVHIQQGLVEGRAAQPGGTAHRRVEEFHVGRGDRGGQGIQYRDHIAHDKYLFLDETGVIF